MERQGLVADDLPLVDRDRGVSGWPVVAVGLTAAASVLQTLASPPEPAAEPLVKLVDGFCDRLASCVCTDNSTVQVDAGLGYRRQVEGGLLPQLQLHHCSENRLVAQLAQHPDLAYRIVPVGGPDFTLR